MAKTSAGLLMYRLKNGHLEVFLAHPGGPIFKNKDDGYWGLPKGEVEPGEPLLEAARREFLEETGLEACGEFFPLGTVMTTSGKTIYAWAFEGDWDKSVPLQSNLFSLEWPPRSGCQQWFPEIDQANFFNLPEARTKISRAQSEFLLRLEQYLLSQGHCR